MSLSHLKSPVSAVLPHVFFMFSLASCLRKTTSYQGEEATEVDQFVPEDTNEANEVAELPRVLWRSVRRIHGGLFFWGTSIMVVNSHKPIYTISGYIYIYDIH